MTFGAPLPGTCPRFERAVAVLSERRARMSEQGYKHEEIDHDPMVKRAQAVVDAIATEED